MLRRLYNAAGVYCAGRRYNPWLDEQRLWGIIIFLSRVFG